MIQTLFSDTRGADSKEPDSSVKTSEYGSCEPSPTNASQGLVYNHPDSDYDNDFASQEVRWCIMDKKCLLCYGVTTPILFFLKIFGIRLVFYQKIHIVQKYWEDVLKRFRFYYAVKKFKVFLLILFEF